MIDNHGREMNYLRVAVTDKCNLRCTYCMPQEKMTFLAKSEILSYEEILKLVQIFADLGVNKLRFTGGEPFVRKDFMYLLENSSRIQGIERINITSNGVLTYPYLEALKNSNITSLNISIDTLQREKFKSITKRDDFDVVMKTILRSIELDIKTKLNIVLQAGVNDDEIIDFVDYFKAYPVDIRFIEHMPFNEKTKVDFIWNAEKIKDVLSEKYKLKQLPYQKNRTTVDYQIDESLFRIGIIAGYTRNFCDSCNRIRLTSTGQIKTCLYADASLDLREMLRSNCSDDELKRAIVSTVQNRHKDGLEAEANHGKKLYESMSKIGG